MAPTPTVVPPALLTALLARLDMSGECWIWTGATNNHGYGRFGAGLYVHRAIYQLTIGPLEEGQFVLHHCDNPPCARPSHLFAGTHSDNMRDMVAKGRNAAAVHPELVVRGERVHGAKLTAAQVTEMRELFARGGVSKMDLARSYGLSHFAVRAILAGQTWKHVEAVA